MDKKSGFVAGTLVHTDKGWIPIQDIKVGDLVLSKPENGEGETGFKPVLNTFVYENKELWLVVAKKHWNSRRINNTMLDSKIHRRISERSASIVTSSQSIWVVGMGILDVQENIQSISVYQHPQWKSVHQLKQNEVIVNKDGILFCIERAQPLYQFQNELVEDKPSYMWYQDCNNYISSYKHADEFEDSEEAKDYFNNDYQEYLEHESNILQQGRVFDVENYKATHSTGVYVEAGNGSVGLINRLKTMEGHYIPFTDTVYNFELADDHTYFVSSAGIWVHQ